MLINSYLDLHHLDFKSGVMSHRLIDFILFNMLFVEDQIED